MGSSPRRYTLDTPLAEVKDVGPARARALLRLGLRRYGELLRHFPNRHEDYPAPRPAAELLFVRRASYEGVVRDIQTSSLNRGLRKITARLGDPTGTVSATWLRGGFAGPRLAPGQRVALSGVVQSFGRQVVFENPDWEPADTLPVHTRRLVPIYPLTSGLHQYWLRSLIYQAVRTEAEGLEDFLPEALRRRFELPPLGWATAQAHFPDDQIRLDQARRRLAFDELFIIQVVALRRRAQWQAQGGRPLPLPTRGLQALLSAQPFQLTGAQQRVIGEIHADLAQAVPMSRLLQGEVGSGKTAVAAVALFTAVANGGQGVLMAPTEILAEQHFHTLSAFYGSAAEPLAAAGFAIPRVELLTGSATRRRKEAVYLALRDGAVDVLVGTHAVIQEGVEPLGLALSVVDEQHRFGVRQRLELRDKGRNPHLLVMTATPIPRTLALTLHGDLDLSLLDEMPPGRQKTKTHLLYGQERHLAYEHVRREAARGRQTFLICPLVEDSPHLEARAATAEYERLRTGELGGLRLGLLHGRMKSADKDAVMRAFRDGEFDVLVSTSVVEVGVDVPNATVMLIEGAERFGLAQLHQFRGRVGRGEHASTCILLTDQEGGEALERLQMVVRSDNGLELAEYDLRVRGPGDFLGVRQSGLPELHLATLNDVGLIESARLAAAQILADDPQLALPEHASLANKLRLFAHRVGEPN
jgi:ATP-dependent DNA helicase RecG